MDVLCVKDVMMMLGVIGWGKMFGVWVWIVCEV